MRLHKLIRELPELQVGGLPDAEITSLTADSRQVRPGSMFVAVRGSLANGHNFLEEAVRSGAVVAVGEEARSDLGIPYLRVADSRAALAHFGAAWNAFPARRLTVIGVTGTDGKTTTAILVHQILKAAGIPSGLVSTVSAIIGDTTLDTGLHVTTPDALQLQGYLAQMVESGLTHCVLEATSHGLAQRRVAACDFDVALVTNITHEHLDYHGSYEAYLQAKGSLFSGLGVSAPKDHSLVRTGILNRDDGSYDYLRRITPVRQISYSLSGDADVIGERLRFGPEGLSLEVRSSKGTTRLQSQLVGAHNAYNLLAAFSAAVEALDVSPAAAARGISEVRKVPGRMEVVDLGQPYRAVVDFAHTPNALRKALQAARSLTHGRILAIFGSAGLRDREKRRMMAEVSAELADITVLTAEDPRTESLEEILEDMVHGARAKGGVEGQNMWRIPDRGDAMRFAVSEARTGDFVLACGKGHEQSMCFGEQEFPWDDRVALRAAIAEDLGIKGPAMPWLPTSSETPS